MKHGPWFIENYGSLSVWNCQGMEKSHHAAKASSQYHGQHGGTKNRTSIIVQQYEFWYRNIQHRYERKLQKKLGDAQRTVPDPLVIDAASQKRNSWYASNAATACAHWREGRIRLGRRYVAREGEAMQRTMDASDTEISIGDGSETNTSLGHDTSTQDSQSSVDSVTNIT